MSSRVFALLLLWPLGCAGFSRGDYWRDSEGDSGGVADDAPDDGEVDDDGGPDDGDPSDGESGDTEADTGDAETGDAGESTGEPAGPSFALDVLPLLRAGCERCHASDGEAADTDFVLGASDDEAYETTLPFVDVDSPASSRLLAKTAGKGHTGGAIYNDHSAQYETMLDWIEHGALP